MLIQLNPLSLLFTFGPSIALFIFLVFLCGNMSVSFCFRKYVGTLTFEITDIHVESL